MDTCACFENYGEKEPSCLESSKPDFAPNWGEGKGEGLTKREGCGWRSGPGCRPLLCACPRAGKCQEPVLQRSWMGGLVGKPRLLIRSCMLLKGLNRQVWFHFPFPYHMPQKKKNNLSGLLVKAVRLENFRTASCVCETACSGSVLCVLALRIQLSAPVFFCCS